jgi:hypothetical protein
MRCTNLSVNSVINLQPALYALFTSLFQLALRLNDPLDLDLGPTANLKFVCVN